jgi:putative acetyltransferase
MPLQASELRVRPARDSDADGLIALVGACFAEHPSCILDVDGEIPELRAIASWAAGLGGRFWVVERAGEVIGSVGVTPAAGPGGVELRKLYVAAAARRRGLGERLCDLVEEEAIRRRAAFIDLWSDTRFLDAHRLYARLGYVRTGATRELHDASDTVEYYFRKQLGRATPSAASLRERRSR